MKDSKQYSEKIQKLYRSLKRRYQKPRKAVYNDPVDAIVYAVVSENITATAAQSAMKRLEDHFIDLNDLRVSRPEEIVEVLAEDTPVTRDTASALTRVLRAVFDKHNTISLETLKKIGKRPARQALEKMDGTDDFVVDYCMLTSLHAHAIPLAKKMTEYLKSNQLVHPDADLQQIKGFLARQISAEKAYEFYALLRRQSESRKAGSEKEKTIRKTKAKAATKTRKKAKKVTKAKER